MTTQDSTIPGACPMCSSPSRPTEFHRELNGRRWTLARCRGCGQHFTAPIPTEEDMRGFYAGDYHRELRTPGGTEAAFGEKYARYAEALGRHLPAGRVVDVGCATGLLVRMLRDRGYEAEGIELNPESAAWGRSHYGVSIQNVPLERSGIAPGSLNALLFTDVLEHTGHPRDYLREAGRLLVPGGIALVTFPDLLSAESRYRRALSRLLRRDWLWTNCHVPLHTWEFTPKTAKACFAAAGFRVVEFRRSQAPHERPGSPALNLLDAPTRLLSRSPLSGLLGTQMEFVIRKA